MKTVKTVKKGKPILRRSVAVPILYAGSFPIGKQPRLSTADPLQRPWGQRDFAVAVAVAVAAPWRGSCLQAPADLTAWLAPRLELVALPAVAQAERAC